MRGTEPREQLGIGPVGGRALAIEQSRSAKDEAACADARYPLGSLGLFAHEFDDGGICNRLTHAMPAGNADDVCLRAIGKAGVRYDGKAAIGADSFAILGSDMGCRAGQA